MQVRDGSAGANVHDARHQPRQCRVVLAMGKVDQLQLERLQGERQVEYLQWQQRGEMAGQCGGQHHAQIGASRQVCRLQVVGRGVGNAPSQALFGRGDLRELDAGVLDAAVSELPSGTWQPGTTVVDALVASGVVRGRNDARRAVAEGGAYVNNVKQDDGERALGADDLLHGRHVLVRRGRRTLGVLTRADA